MFKYSKKTTLGFDSGFKPLAKGMAVATSKTIKELNILFSSEITLNEVFLDVRNLKDKTIFPKKGFYNFIITSKSMSSLLFLDVFEKQLKSILIVATKMNKLNRKFFEKYAAKTIVFSNDELSDLKCKQIIICSTHAKAICFQINENYYTITGSGNPSENSKEEQYVIFNDETIFNNFQKICL